jgi:hypothetical protein
MDPVSNQVPHQVPQRVLPKWDTIFTSDDTICVDHRGYSGEQFYPLRKSVAAFIPYVDKPPNPTLDEETKALESTTIDIGVIQAWLQACDSSHGSHCSFRTSAVNSQYTGPRWLIDVHRKCIIPGKRDHVYYALSYVWGQSQSARLSTSNLDALRQDGALNSPSVTLPNTIKDAIRLVTQLNGQYIWVDRLCIPQDGGSVKQQELDAMALIYAGAYATIVAAQGEDAEEGLPGIPNGTKLRDQHFAYSARNGLSRKSFRRSLIPTSFRPPAVKWVDLSIPIHTRRIQNYSRLLLATTWNSRGWTFQEQLFSRRKIIFQDDTVNWECHCTAWHEAQVDLGLLAREPCRKLPTSKTNRFGVTAWPDLHRYARLVSIYNERYFTFAEDVLDAFAGVLSALSHSFSGGFISGLPQMFFDAALLWQPYYPVIRRESSISGSSRAVLPSWSWVGWHGNLHSESWRSGYGYMRRNPDEYLESDPDIWEPCSWRTISTVQWSHSVELIGSRIAISSGCEGKISSDNSTNEEKLPPGWSRKHCEITHRAFYCHESDPKQEFWYPIPIQDRNEENSVVAPMSSRFLHCRTRRAHLFGVDYLQGVLAYPSCEVLSLKDGNGSWAGVLRVHEPKYGSRHYLDRLGKGIELIELSKGEVQNQVTEEMSFDEWNMPECPRQAGLYKFYNVMWIGWKDGVAYRKAIGRVVEYI